MPIPTPGQGESQDKFISRFMSNSAMQKDYPDQKQRAAVAYSQWKGKGKKEEAESKLNDPTMQAPIKDAFDRWYNEVFSQGKFGNHGGSEGYLKDKNKQTIQASDGIALVEPKTSAGPNYPDKGTDHLYKVTEKSETDLFKKVCEEIKTESDKIFNPKKKE